MEYETVELGEKIVVGVAIKTGNEDPKVGGIIGGLWEKLYGEGINEKVKNKVNQRAIGLYTNYNFADNTYTALAGNEVSEVGNEELNIAFIPAGKYAKFSVHGNMQKAVCDAWDAIWKMDLDRSFTVDFEEYLNCDFENADIDIYVALK